MKGMGITIGKAALAAVVFVGTIVGIGALAISQSPRMGRVK